VPGRDGAELANKILLVVCDGHVLNFTDACPASISCVPLRTFGDVKRLSTGKQCRQYKSNVRVDAMSVTVVKHDQ
jgi:hypothetical protein